MLSYSGHAVSLKSGGMTNWQVPGSKKSWAFLTALRKFGVGFWPFLLRPAVRWAIRSCMKWTSSPMGFGAFNFSSNQEYSFARASRLFNSAASDVPRATPFDMSASKGEGSSCFFSSLDSALAISDCVNSKLYFCSAVVPGIKRFSMGALLSRRFRSASSSTNTDWLLKNPFVFWFKGHLLSCGLWGTRRFRFLALHTAQSTMEENALRPRIVICVKRDLFFFFLPAPFFFMVWIEPFRNCDWQPMSFVESISPSLSSIDSSSSTVKTAVSDVSAAAAVATAAAAGSAAGADNLSRMLPFAAICFDCNRRNQKKESVIQRGKDVFVIVRKPVPQNGAKGSFEKDVRKTFGLLKLHSLESRLRRFR